MRITTIVTLCLAVSFPTVTFASSGEAEMVYAGDGKYRATRPLWANAYAPNDPIHNEDGVNDLNPGDLFSIGRYDVKCTFLINGFPSNLETYDKSLQEGDRVLIRNERRWVQVLNKHTSNCFDEGVIESFDGKTVAIRYYTNLPSGRVRSESRSYPISDDMIVQLEGEHVSAKDALQRGRHLRMYRPRPQSVLVFDESGLRDTREFAGGGGAKSWVRQGFFRGIGGKGVTLFCVKHNGEWVDTFASGQIRDIDGYNLGPGAEAAYARPGDRLITASRIVSFDSAFDTVDGTYIPADDGSVIGEIFSITADSVSVKVARCPTGLAEDVVEEIVTVRIADTAEFHLNGARGSSREETLKVGHRVRILQEFPAGAAIVRDVDAGKMAGSLDPVQPMFPTGRPSALAVGGEPFQQAQTVNVLENELASLKVFLYTVGQTRYEWYRNGLPVPGSAGVVSSFHPITFDEYADLPDDGAEFQCVATTAAGTVRSAPIRLQVSPDQRPLKLAGYFAAGKNTVLVSFSKKVKHGSSETSAENAANYSISNNVRIQKATLTGNQQTVVLETTPLSPGTTYAIDVRNIEDTSATPNLLADDSSGQVELKVAFRYFRFTLVRKKTLNARLTELRLKVGDRGFGKGVRSTPSTADRAKSGMFDDDGRTHGQFDVGEFVVMDFGAKQTLAPDAIEYRLTTSTRPIARFRLEGSNDGENWIQLTEQDGAVPKGTPRDAYARFPIDIGKLDVNTVLRARRVQTITFPQPDGSTSPVVLDGKSSSGLPVTYQVLAGGGKVDGNRFEPKANGPVWLRAVQEGSAEYYSAHPVDVRFEVTSQ